MMYNVRFSKMVRRYEYWWVLEDVEKLDNKFGDVEEDWRFSEPKEYFRGREHRVVCGMVIHFLAKHLLGRIDQDDLQLSPLLSANTTVRL